MRAMKWLMVLGTGFAVSACANPTGTGFLDPHEDRNRQVHEFNKSSDGGVVAPMANLYGRAVPSPARQGVNNFATNLELPGDFVNNVLQADIEGAVRNLFRFAINSTVGIGGIFDPASVVGLEQVDTDFGETLYVWGVPEGNYIELPFLGPSTERHLAGRVVDVFINPLNSVVDSPEIYYIAAATLLSKLDERHVYSSTVESILYESEDSYAAARRLYLDNRRYKLGVEVTEEEIDEIELLFLELYGE